LLFVSSLVARNYVRAASFLTSLAIVALGGAAAILGEITGFGHNILGG
jgi:hypothetical protein